MNRGGSVAEAGPGCRASALQAADPASHTDRITSHGCHPETRRSRVEGPYLRVQRWCGGWGLSCNTRSGVTRPLPHLCPLFV